MDLLWDIVQERWLTVIYTLRQLALAREYAGRIIGLRNGEVQMDTAADQVNLQDLAWLYDAEQKSTTPA